MQPTQLVSVGLGMTHGGDSLCGCHVAVAVQVAFAENKVWQLHRLFSSLQQEHQGALGTDRALVRA